MRPILWPNDMILKVKVTYDQRPQGGELASISWGETNEKLLPSMNPWPSGMVKFISVWDS